ncbi:amidohydrolase [Gordonibacter sp. 28C]|uniref:amidohydrolase n=1 Tax=Gordonibacter sp. 28C TaxID=2078569 RepID=UPI000DF81936|nr:amidohydrolase [Gordonibacter sp. 28C]RDB63246.1 amidohydrolase [Gordonibacter sp. 28C]
MDQSGISALSRRAFLAGGAVALASIGLGMYGCSTPAGNGGTGTDQGGTDVKADLYFENGTVITANEQNGVAEALAVKDGRVVFAGSAADGTAYKNAAGSVVDLQGKTVMPGMIDGHIHTASPDFFDFSLIGLTSSDDMLKTIKDYVDSHPDKKTYSGFGYAAALFPGEELEHGPKKERLDAISPDKPILVYSFDGHGAWLNSKAFEYLGITKDTESTPGGKIVKDENGGLWGILADSAMSLAADYPFDQENLSLALPDYLAHLNSLGYTSIFSPPGNGFLPLPADAYQKLADQNELTLRVRGAGIVTSWQTEDDLKRLEELKAAHTGDLFKVNAAKFFTDGVMDNESALLLEPYTDNPGSHGDTGWQQDALDRAVASVNRMGFLAHLHAIGDGGVRMALDAIEYAEQNVPDDRERNAITHLQLVSDDDVPRFAELNVVAVADPYWHLKTPQYWEPKEKAALGERAEKMYPMKSFVDVGAVLVSASDYPVTANPNPFEAIEAGVTRNLVNGEEYEVADIADIDDPTYLLWPEERVDVQRMIRSFTADAAWALGLEDETGSLEEGKSADFVVVDQNVLDVDPLAIKNTKVLATYLRGKKVFDAETGNP